MTDFKNSKAPLSTVTYDRKQVKAPTHNIYKAIRIIGNRVEQLNAEMKDELLKKLKEFETYQDSLEEIFENKEQIDISRFYERLPKSVAIAMQEWLDGKLDWIDASDDEFGDLK